MKATITAMILIPLLSALAAYGIYCVNSRRYDRWFAWGIVIGAISIGTVSISSFVWSAEERLKEMEEQIRKLREKKVDAVGTAHDSA